MKHIIINIGRQFGSGGFAVAEELSRKLGIPAYDSELITKAAQDSGFSPEFFLQSVETRRSFSLKSIFTGPVGDDYISEGELFKMQSNTIRKIAEQGSAIIVGRCSDYILRDMDCTIDVFLTSPEEVRIERVSKREGISREKAVDLIEKKDRQRAEYYNYFTFGAWGVASTYDLCLDSSILGIEGTSEFIIDFAKKTGHL